MSDRRTCYVAGPMRNYENMNFPAFDQATDDLRYQGWTVISPAELDRDSGYDGSRPPTDFELVEMFQRDLNAIDTVDTIVLLPGWRDSDGVKVELRHASKRKPSRPSLAVYEDGTVTPMEWTPGLVSA